MSASLSATQPVLCVFAISHFCEKARWALDHAGIDYRLQHLGPGLHIRFARQLGLPRSSLPILISGSRLVQGSSAIIDWAERHRAPGRPSLQPDDGPADSVVQLEKRLDEVLGVHVRRYYYSEALVEYPQLVRPLFTRNLRGRARVVVELGWSFTRRRMISRLDLGYMQGIESREKVERELDWLDGLLAAGQPYLQGGRFSRLDITAASLLAPLVKPPRHPEYSTLRWPPNVAMDCAGWNRRPSLQWVTSIYQACR